eukprot:gene30410-38013_t
MYTMLIDNGFDDSSLKEWLDNRIEADATLVGVSTYVAYSLNDAVVNYAGKSVLPEAYDKQQQTTISATSEDVTRNNTFLQASVSKTVTWTALTMLLDAGAFTLDDSIDAALDFIVRNPNHPDTAITYRHVYTHTTGIKDDYLYEYGDNCAEGFYSKDLDTFLPTYLEESKSWANWETGTKEKYSNMATALAALLVERLSGVDFNQFTQRYIFAPLGMSDTSWAFTTTSARPYETDNEYEYGYDYGKSRLRRLTQSSSAETSYLTSRHYCFPDWPSGQLYTTAADMAKFALAMMAYGQYDEACLYSEATGRLVFEEAASSVAEGAGLGWFIGSKHGYVDGAGHDGAEFGASSNMYLNLASNYVTGWMSNSAVSVDTVDALNARLKEEAQSISSGSESS